jgi:hypothetical protein
VNAANTKENMKTKLRWDIQVHVLGAKEEQQIILSRKKLKMANAFVLAVRK